MQLTLRPYVTAGVAVVGAGLIHVTPVAAPRLEQRAVELVAAGDIIDLVNPIDAVGSSLGGETGLPLASVTDALTSGGAALSAEFSDALPSLGDLGGAFDGGLPDVGALLSVAADPALVDLLDPITLISQLWMGLIELLYLVPGFNVILPVLGGGLFLGFLLLVGAASYILDALGLQDIYNGIYNVDVIDPALPAAFSTALGDITSPFNGAAEVLDPTILVQDLSTALDPGVLTSDLSAALDPSVLTSDLSAALDPSAIADPGAVFDPAALADIGTLLTSMIPDI